MYKKLLLFLVILVATVTPIWALDFEITPCLEMYCPYGCNPDRQNGFAHPFCCGEGQYYDTESEMCQCTVGEPCKRLCCQPGTFCSDMEICCPESESEPALDCYETVIHPAENGCPAYTTYIVKDKQDYTYYKEENGICTLVTESFCPDNIPSNQCCPTDETIPDSDCYETVIHPAENGCPAYTTYTAIECKQGDNCPYPGYDCGGDLWCDFENEDEKKDLKCRLAKDLWGACGTGKVWFSKCSPEGHLTLDSISTSPGWGVMTSRTYLGKKYIWPECKSDRYMVKVRLLQDTPSINMRPTPATVIDIPINGVSIENFGPAVFVYPHRDSDGYVRMRDDNGDYGHCTDTSGVMIQGTWKKALFCLDKNGGVYGSTDPYSDWCS